MNQWYSAKELVGLPGMPLFRENVARKVKVENWKFRQRSGRGGRREYALESLPQVTQAALSASNLDRIDSISVAEEVNSAPRVFWTNHRVDRSLALPTQTDDTTSLAKTSIEAIAHQSLESKTEYSTDSWLKILQAYEFWCESKSFASAIVRDLEFVRVYNEQQFNLPNWVYYNIKHISHSILKRKHKLRQIGERINALGGNYGNRKNKGRIDSNPSLQQAIETCIAAGGKHWGCVAKSC